MSDEFITDLEEKFKALRAIRSEANLSQREVADLLGVHWSRISRWEEGEEYPRFPTLVQLCRLLDNLQIQNLNRRNAEKGKPPTKKPGEKDREQP